MRWQIRQDHTSNMPEILSQIYRIHAGALYDKFLDSSKLTKYFTKSIK